MIRILVLTGLLFVLLDKIRDRETSSGKKDSGKVTAEGHPYKRHAIMSVKIFFWSVAAPCSALGAWATVWSNHPLLAMEGMLSLVTYLVLFYLTVESIQTRKQQRTLLWVIVGTAVFLSIIGIFKRFDVISFFWWDYSSELGRSNGMVSVSGTYGNRNHMAGFLDMAIPMVLGMILFRSRPPGKRLGMITLVLFLLITQTLTLSRGGWGATTGALVFMVVVLLFKKNFYHKPLLVSIVVAVVVVGCVVMASTPVVNRLITLTQQDAEDNLTARITCWRSTCNLIKDHPFTGTGPGTFARVFPEYLEPGLYGLPLFAHNDYLQFAADTGVLFFPLMLWLLFLFFRTGFRKIKSRSRQTMGISLGAMAAVTAILIHSYSDFNLHVPANTVLFTVIMGIMASGWREA